MCLFFFYFLMNYNTITKSICLKFYIFIYFLNLFNMFLYLKKKNHFILKKKSFTNNNAFFKLIFLNKYDNIHSYYILNIIKLFTILLYLRI